jgi:hypothetical protein
MKARLGWLAGTGDMPSQQIFLTGWSVRPENIVREGMYQISEYMAETESAEKYFPFLR